MPSSPCVTSCHLQSGSRSVPCSALYSMSRHASHKLLTRVRSRWEQGADFASLVIQLWLGSNSRTLEEVLQMSEVFSHSSLRSGIVLDGRWSSPLILCSLCSVCRAVQCSAMRCSRAVRCMPCDAVPCHTVVRPVRCTANRLSLVSCGLSHLAIHSNQRSHSIRSNPTPCPCPLPYALCHPNPYASRS